METITTLSHWMECGVCLNNKITFHIVCANGHSFCEECHSRMVVCPMCRKELFLNVIHDLSRQNIIKDLLGQFTRNLQLIGSIDIDAKDCDGKWYQSRIVKWKQNKCLVHYYGWENKWDEWVSTTSERIAPLHTHTLNWIQMVREGDPIEFKLRHQTVRWFRGKIQKINPSKKSVYVVAVDMMYRECYKIKLDRDNLSPIGVHTPPPFYFCKNDL